MRKATMIMCIILAFCLIKCKIIDSKRYNNTVNVNERLLFGFWTSLSDTNWKVSINKDEWRDFYGKDTSVNGYYLFGKDKDSIEVFIDNDTLVYHISSISENYLDLSYFGRKNFLNSGGNMLSFVKH